MISKETLQIVRKEMDRQKDPNCEVYPTNEEVLLAESVFNDLIDVGNILGLEMLSAWAVNNYQHYNNIAWARKLKFDISEILYRIDSLKPNDSQKLYLACCILGVNYETDGSEMNQIVIYTGLAETKSGAVERVKS